MNNELLEISIQWAANTVRDLKWQMAKLKIKGTRLRHSIKSKATLQGSEIIIDTSMLLTGRFVDMGAGRGQKANTKTTKRKAKKFYSKTFYSRYSSLRGVAVMKITHRSLKIIEENIAQ